MSRAPLLVSVFGAVLVVTAACSSSGGSAGPADPTRSSPVSCSRVAPSRVTWPAPVPADLPAPAGGAITATRRLAAGGVVVELRVPDSLRGQVGFVRTAFPAVRILPGRGDAEEDEADIPFRRGTLSGQLRLRSTGPCSTSWILTVSHG